MNWCTELRVACPAYYGAMMVFTNDCNGCFVSKVCWVLICPIRRILPMEANSTGGQGSRRAVAPSDDDDTSHIKASEVLYLTTLNIGSGGNITHDTAIYRN